MGAERKRQIYELCRVYDVLILEDDPHYYCSPDDGNLGKSFFALDKDDEGEEGEARVLRFHFEAHSPFS